MNPNKALWEKGDFTRIADTMRESGEALVSGDRTTAPPEAKLGAEVLGVDIARNLVEAGKKRAKDAGLTNCRFVEGDANIPATFIALLPTTRRVKPATYSPLTSLLPASLASA